MYIDYREKLRELHSKLIKNESETTVGAVINNALNFYDWNVKQEDAYRNAHELSNTHPITDKAVYEFVCKKLH